MEPPPVWMVEEWNFFQMAKWMGVAPWDLLKKPAYWKNRAEFYMSIEAGLGKVEKKKQ